MMGSGRVICIAGQVGWDPSGTFPAGFVAQSRQTLQNIVDILAQANCGPQHIARMTWFVVDMDEYTSNLSSIGDVYREVIGRHFPAMTLVQVGALVEPDARLEIEATAIAPV